MAKRVQLLDRFIVFGCKKDLLVQSSASTLSAALAIANRSTDGFKARIWDKVYNKFIR